MSLHDVEWRQGKESLDQWVAEVDIGGDVKVWAHVARIHRFDARYYAFVGGNGVVYYMSPAWWPTADEAKRSAMREIDRLHGDMGQVHVKTIWDIERDADVYEADIYVGGGEWYRGVVGRYVLNGDFDWYYMVTTGRRIIGPHVGYEDAEDAQHAAQINAVNAKYDI